MGTSAAQLGKLDVAIDTFKKQLIKPDFIEAYNNMGLALKEQGKLADAFEALTKQFYKA